MVTLPPISASEVTISAMPSRAVWSNPPPGMGVPKSARANCEATRKLDSIWGIPPASAFQPMPGPCHSVM